MWLACTWSLAWAFVDPHAADFDVAQTFGEMDIDGDAKVTEDEAWHHVRFELNTVLGYEVQQEVHPVVSQCFEQGDIDGDGHLNSHEEVTKFIQTFHSIVDEAGEAVDEFEQTEGLDDARAEQTEEERAMERMRESGAVLEDEEEEDDW